MCTPFPLKHTQYLAVGKSVLLSDWKADESRQFQYLLAAIAEDVCETANQLFSPAHCTVEEIPEQTATSVSPRDIEGDVKEEDMTGGDMEGGTHNVRVCASVCIDKHVKESLNLKPSTVALSALAHATLIHDFRAWCARTHPWAGVTLSHAA